MTEDRRGVIGDKNGIHCILRHFSLRLLHVLRVDSLDLPRSIGNLSVRFIPILFNPAKNCQVRRGNILLYCAHPA